MSLCLTEARHPGAYSKDMVLSSDCVHFSSLLPQFHSYPREGAGCTSELWDSIQPLSLRGLKDVLLRGAHYLNFWAAVTLGVLPLFLSLFISWVTSLLIFSSAF